MTVRISFIVSIVLLLFLASCNKNPPNIVLIMSDDQGYGDFGFTKNPYVSTPNLDQLKKESVYFDRFYVSPVCAPTRASLLTGRYHLRTGTTWVTHGKEIMRSEEKTIAESLGEHGYVTGCFGKWHNGEHYPHNPIGQGFDTFFGFCAGHWNNYFDTHLEYNGKEVKTTGYITDVLTDSALNFIERHRNGPFFCYIPYNAPHGPFQVPDRYFDKYKGMGLDDKNAAVYGMCENIDDNVGRVLDKLKQLNIDDNTIILYLTDNGPNGHRYNAGMKGIKAHVDEGGVRTPLLIRYPGKLPAGDTIFGLASHIDLLPTLHGLTELDLNTPYPLDGIDLSRELIENRDIEDRMIFSHQVNSVVKPTPVSVRTPRYRLAIKYGDTLLYDMIADPGQEQDIKRDFPGIASSLTMKIDQWFSDVTMEGTGVPPVPVGYNESPRVTLPAPEASLEGSISFKGEMGWANDWLIGFKEGNNKATWPIEVIETGEYEVYAKLACNNPSAGDKLIWQTSSRQHTFALDKTFSAPRVFTPDRVQRNEVYERNWPVVKLGNVSLTQGIDNFIISCTGDGLADLELKEIIILKKE
ncbi:MAG: arylsulfatase [Bacteroidales bacterium]|nr:arylsulfatase [Bacteroidales bacterium]